MYFVLLRYLLSFMQTTGANPEGAHTVRRAPHKIGKNMIFWRKIVIFHAKYPKNVRASLRSAQFFKVRPSPPLT